MAADSDMVGDAHCACWSLSCALCEEGWERQQVQETCGMKFVADALNFGMRTPDAQPMLILQRHVAEGQKV